MIAIKLFLNSDFYGEEWICKRGKSFYEPRIGPGQPGFIPGVTNVPNQGPFSVGYVPARDIPLRWKTFSEAAIESGNSRLLAGVHYRSGNIQGIKMGRRIGKIVYRKATKLFSCN